ncbi:MAG: glycosyltransferase family 2 protein, partial [bacterium]
PKISIITATFNSAKTIAKTIESVNRQTYKTIEQIFIDNQSSDDTIKIIKAMAPRALLVSEKDNGIFEAMNKGYKLAAGEVVGTLNSDDYFLHERVVENIVSSFSNSDIDYVCGRIMFFDHATGNFSHYFGQKPSLRDNLVRMSIAHPTVYVQKEIFDKLGPYDDSYRIAADFDWCLRLLRGDYRYVFLEDPMIAVSLAGLSARNYRLAAQEELAIKLKYYPERKWRFQIIYYRDYLARCLRDWLLRMKLGKVVQIARRFQGKVSDKSIL